MGLEDIVKEELYSTADVKEMLERTEKGKLNSPSIIVCLYCRTIRRSGKQSAGMSLPVGWIL